MTHKEIVESLKNGDRVVITFYPRITRISTEKLGYITAKQYDKLRPLLVMESRHEGGLSMHYYKLK